MTEPGDLAYLPSDIEFIALEACPWCDSKSIYKIATRGDGLPVMRCPECQLAFLGNLAIGSLSLLRRGLLQAKRDSRVGARLFWL